MRPSEVVDPRAFEGRTVGGKYVLRECLGKGGFGAVFLSDQHVLGVPLRRVALKLSSRAGMTVETAREVFADAFLLAEAMDSITDTEARQHLVHVYDAGIASDADGRGFLTMEFVQGTTLATQFASYGKVPESILMPWVIHVCRALRGLHMLVPPLLHRDIKPDNVLLGSDQVVRLVDFGLAAKLLHLGYVPGVAGTLAYMAPETSQGESVPASDVYSVGLLIYEGLTGRHPFSHLVPPVDLPDALHSRWLYDAKRRVPAVPPSSLNNTVSTAIDAIVLRCLEFEPGRRFRDAGELLDKLTRQPERRPMGSISKTERFQLLRRQGEALVEAGESAEAAARFVDAWKLAEFAAILRTRAERAALLTRIIDSYRMIPNEFQAARYEDIRRKELGGGR